MKKVLVIKTLLLWLISINSVHCQGQDTLFVSRYGLDANTRVNAIPGINRIMESCAGRQNIVIKFDKGRYDFWPEYAARRNYYESNTTIVNPRTCAVLIERQNNITVDGSGATFMFHGKMQPFTVDSSKNITIKNVSVDWEIPFGAEAEIMDVSPSYFDLKFDVKQFHYLIENDKLYFTGEGWKEMWGGVKWNDPMEFERETLEVTPGTDDDLLGSNWETKYTAKEMADGLVRIYFNHTALLKKGNYLLLRIGVRDHAGVFMKDSKNILLENINMYSNTGMNFLAQYTEDIVCKKINCIPSPARKVLAGHDDGLHFANCKGLITIDSCSFRGIMDDAVNFHNTYLLFKEKLDDKTLRCKFMHHQSLGFTWGRTGEEVGFVKAETMSTISKTKIASYKILSPDLVEIGFEETVPGDLKVDDALENLTWNADAVVRNCYFGQHRARGILVSTPGKVVIESNVFETSGAAICVPGDANHWYEGGAVKDITIRNNLFKAACNTSAYQFSEGIITVYPGLPKMNLTLPAYHSNIKITGNRFEAFDYPVLYVINTDGIAFNGNFINRSYRYKARNDKAAMLTFDGCRKIEVKGNILQQDVLGKNIRLIRTAKKELLLDKKQGLKLEEK